MREALGWGAACAVAAGIGCSREPEPSSGPSLRQQTPPDLNGAVLRVPREGGPAGYVGSKVCRECHEDQHASWHRTYHRTMTQVAGPGTIQADFNGVVLTNEGVRFSLSLRNGDPWVRMERIGAGDGAAGAALETRMGLVTGSHHMQVFWVPGDEGNTQIGFPFTWLIPERRWVPRHSTFIRPPDAAHRSEIWNVVCSRCHATGIEPRVDSGRRTVDTRAGELGIACEACHGPGEAHTTARRAATDPSGAVPAATLAAEIVHPEKIPTARSAQVCGFCHSMKWLDRSEQWRANGFRYRPGDDLETTTPIIQPSRVDSIAGLGEFLTANPELLDDFFWPDSMIRVSGREYNGLIESPCYSGGEFSCLSCHSMHESEPDDLLARNREGNGACIPCHSQYAAVDALKAHTRHGADSYGSQCYNCHMPHTTYGVLKAIRSHQISSPRIADDLAAGRPNACSLCHLDRPLSWVADQLAAQYGQAQPELPPDWQGVSHGVRLALAGDAGQRALLAWHLGWGPALQASGTNWVTPILGQLLEDPYAAVRCVAERSLRAVGAGVPGAYDFASRPEQRAPVREAVWKAWQAGQADPTAALRRVRTLADAPDAGDLGSALDRWTRRRDDRPIRLRE